MGQKPKIGGFISDIVGDMFPPADPKTKDKGLGQEAHGRWAMLWVHEWGHLLTHFRDPDAVDASGKPLDKDPSGKTKRVYGWEKVVDYAKHAKPDDIAKSPDNLAYFGAAMYWRDIHWASGYARTEPEPEAGPKAGGSGGAGRSKRESRVMRRLLEASRVD